MILNLDRFVQLEQPAWRELETLLNAVQARPGHGLSREEAERLYALYYRAAAGLSRVEHGACAPSLQADLQRLVTRAYGEVFAAPRRLKWTPRRWVRRLAVFFVQVPCVFRRHLQPFGLAVGLLLLGAAFGAFSVSTNAAAVTVLLPADYLAQPAQRVRLARTGAERMTLAEETPFSAQLIAHNIQTALLILALGLTFGLGTGVVLFYNGALLGAVAARYAQQGFGWFVAGWLLPHGVIEVPSLLLAGQAGFMIAARLLAGGREPRRQGLRRILPDWLTLLGGLCGLLVWAGLTEAFFSSHHGPGVHESVKAAVGACELLLLLAYLITAGRAPRPELS